MCLDLGTRPGEISPEMATSSHNILLLAPDTDTVQDAMRSHLALFVAHRNCFSQLMGDAKEGVACIDPLDSKEQPAPALTPTTSAPAPTAPQPSPAAPPVPYPVSFRGFSGQWASLQSNDQLTIRNGQDLAVHAIYQDREWIEAAVASRLREK